VYRSPKFDRTGLIVVHQLAITEESLWLRVLGKEGNQNRAIQELVGQPTPSALYASIGEILADYRTNLESRSPLTLDEEDLIMNLSAAYLKKREEWKDEGKLEGKTETAINLLKKGMNLGEIAEVTGLSTEAIENLRDRASL
jgi:predicted transposase/invertase (TIGR01784 family)